jgi:hypothetical protein
MSYIRRPRRYLGRIPGPIEGPLGGLLDDVWDVFSPFKTAPVRETVKAGRELEEPGIWSETIARIEAGEQIPPEDLPEEAPPPNLREKLPRDIRERYPEPSFIERHGKAMAIAGAALFGYYWWKGRKG